MQFLIVSANAITQTKIENLLNGIAREVFMTAKDQSESLACYKDFDQDENIKKTVIIKLREPIIEGINIIKAIRKLENKLQVDPSAILTIIDYSSVHQEVLAKMAGSDGFLPLHPTRADIIKELDRIFGPNCIIEMT
jgi:DNA-binding NarL/FixJ family response regulator